MWGLKKNWHCLGLFLRLFWTFHLTFSKPPSYILSGTHQILFPLVAYCDKWVIWKLRQTNILRPFLDIFEKLPETQIFFAKLPPCTAKTVFSEFFKKYFFPIAPDPFFYRSQVIAFVMIPKWKLFWKIIPKNIFEENILPKYFQ